MSFSSAGRTPSLTPSMEMMHLRRLPQPLCDLFGGKIANHRVRMVRGKETAIISDGQYAHHITSATKWSFLRTTCALSSGTELVVGMLAEHAGFSAGALGCVAGKLMDLHGVGADVCKIFDGENRDD